MGNSLVVQWLGLGTFTTEGLGLIPGLRRPHMLWSNKVRVPQPWSLCSRARELQLLSPSSATTEACAP